MEFSTDNQKIRIAILAFIAGLILAFIVFPRPEVETVYKFETKVKSDTIYTRVVDTVYVPKMSIHILVLISYILTLFLFLVLWNINKLYPRSYSNLKKCYFCSIVIFCILRIF